ncbi:MAG: IPTL-CTERM sorting domain-containing protein [Thermoanaerobaculia bacterium]|nr:IPTL-CTERM sorting domain-containing protein [Thermoanaerobaculia bacterium]
MPEDDPGPICTQPAQPERPSEQRHRHTFTGATPERLAASLSLATVASDAGGLLEVSSDLTSFGIGHSFPTGISIRNALLVIEASWNGQPLAQIDGPTIPFYGSDEVPGAQPGDYAGMPGKGYAKVLEGRINGQGPVVRPVLFIDAEGVYDNTLLSAGTTDTVTVRFQLPPQAKPGDLVEVTSRLLYRRSWRALAVTKGWTETPQGGPIEIESHRNDLEVVLIEGGGGSVIDIPTLGSLGLGVLALLLGWVGFLALRRR